MPAPVTKAIIPVAGNGTRMYPLGVTTPKCLVTILNKPLLWWSIDALKQNGITELVLVISAGVFGQKIRDFVEAHPVEGVSIKFAIQEQQLGTAHVVQMAKEFFSPGEQFVFMYGDDLYGPGTIQSVISVDGLAVTGMKVSDPEKWGIFHADETGKLINVIEKPKEFVGDIANIGCMKLDYRIFELFDKLQISVRGEYELTDSLLMLAKLDRISVLQTQDYWIPIGYPWHILDATERFLPDIEDKREGQIGPNVTITGKIILPKSSVIKPGTVIEGNVMIGENCIIGPNAYLRQNVVIGNDCVVGFNVELKNTVVGDGTKIPHQAFLGDSVLGKNVNFSGLSGAANLRHDEATVRTPIKGQMVDSMRQKLGTIIGDNVKLGIGTKIFPGRKIWPNKTTRPGEIVDKDIVG